MKEQIIQLYSEGKNIRTVAKELGYGNSWVAKVIKKAGISRPKKPSIESQKKRIHTCSDFSEDFIHYLDGLLISDGSIILGNGINPSAWYRQTCSHREWLEEIKIQFSANGIEGVIGNENRTSRKSHWQFQTKRYDKLTLIHKKWYVNNAKIVPSTINVKNKLLMKNWIYGDGTLLKGSTLRWCTDSFSEQEVDSLVSKINESYGIQSRKMYFGKAKDGSSKFRITLCLKTGLEKFYLMLGTPDVKCMSYKWRNNV